MNTMKTFALLAVLTVLLVTVGGWIGGRENGIQYATVFFLIALGFNFLSYWFSDKVVLAVYRAKQVGPDDEPRLYSTVERLAERAGLPMPRVYVVPSDALNAFATGRNPRNAAVACTRGILKILDDAELEGVLGHELSHVKNRDILLQTIAASVVGAITWISHMARWAAIFGGYGGRDRRGGGGLGLLVLTILAPLIALVLHLWISRTREYAADRGGAELAGSPLGLMRALQKLESGTRHATMPAGPATAHMFTVSPLRGVGLLGLFRTHPTTEKRVRALEKMMF